MRKLLYLFLAGATFGFTACGDDDDEVTTNNTRTFQVKVECVSQPNTINSTRANGAVPLSPGVFAVFTGTDPVFIPNQQADAGLELIAEDGVVATKVASLALNTAITSGKFEAPGGPDNDVAIFPGETATFTITAKPGDKLQLATMFVQSNDWFYGFSNGGLDLFNGTTPINGEVTPQLVVYDAGTEEDTAPGTGPNQKPAQNPTDTNIGPPDMVNAIIPAATRHPSFTIPLNTAVIKVTVTPQ